MLDLFGGHRPKSVRVGHIWVTPWKRMCTSICSTQPRHTSNEVLAYQYFLLLVAFSYPPFLFADAPAWRVVGTIWGKVRTLSSPFRTALELSIPKPTTIAKCRPQLILWLRWLWWSWGSLVCAWFMLILLQYCLLGLLEHHWEILRAFHSVSRFGMFQLSGWLRWTVYTCFRAMPATSNVSAGTVRWRAGDTMAGWRARWKPRALFLLGDRRSRCHCLGGGNLCRVEVKEKEKEGPKGNEKVRQDRWQPGAEWIRWWDATFGGSLWNTYKCLFYAIFCRHLPKHAHLCAA